MARSPGSWFEEVLGSLVAQDYQNLSILVIDAASDDEVKPRVARAAPGAYVRRLATDPGFGAAANEVLEIVEGAAFFLVCQDDAALDPDAVRRLVEEAYRSNAAVVGPKLVDWDELTVAWQSTYLDQGAPAELLATTKERVNADLKSFCPITLDEGTPTWIRRL